MRLNGIQLFPKFFSDPYSLDAFRKDFFAAIAVALLAIPQCIAYALIAGLPLFVGFYSAIFGAFFVGIFSHSRHLIAGPTTGIAILIQTVIYEILHTYYSHFSKIQQETLSLQILLLIVMTVAGMQIFASLMRVGKILQFVSRSVISGYFVGVASAIVVTQLFYFFGLSAAQSTDPLIYTFGNFLTKIQSMHFPTFMMGSFSFFILWIFHKRFKYVPNTLIMLMISISLISYFRDLQLFDSIKTIQTISYDPYLFSWEVFYLDWSLFQQVFPAAFAIGILSMLEIFSVSHTLSVKTRSSTRVQQNIFGCGVANLILGAIFPALPCSSSISRSISNYQFEAKSKLSSIFSAGFLILFLWLLKPFIELIPIASMSALLLFIIPAMLPIEQVRLCLKTTKTDAAVFLLTLLACFVFRLDAALYIGIGLSIALYLYNSADPHLVEYAFSSSGHLMVVEPNAKVKRSVRIIGIAGELYFGNVDLLQNTLHHIAKSPYVKSIVLRLNKVYYVDASMCFMIKRLHEYLHHSNKNLVISGVTEEVWHVFRRSGLLKQIGKENFYLSDETKPQLSTWKACLRAQELSRLFEGE